MSKKLFLTVVVGLINATMCAMQFRDIIQKSKAVPFFKLHDMANGWVHMPVYLLDSPVDSPELIKRERFVKQNSMFLDLGITLDPFNDYIHLLSKSRKAAITRSIFGDKKKKVNVVKKQSSVSVRKSSKKSKCIKKKKKNVLLEKQGIVAVSFRNNYVTEEDSLFSTSVLDFEKINVKKSLKKFFEIIERVINIVNFDAEQYSNVDFAALLLSRQNKPGNKKQEHVRNMCIVKNFLCALYDNKESVVFNGKLKEDDLDAEVIFDKIIGEFGNNFKDVVNDLYASIDGYVEKNKYDYSDISSLSVSLD